MARRKPLNWPDGSFGWVPFPDEVIPPEDVVEFTRTAILNEMAHAEEESAMEHAGSELPKQSQIEEAYALMCDAVITLRMEKDALLEDVRRLNASLAASRKNEQTARDERDEALAKLAKVAEFVGLLDNIPEYILRPGYGVVPPETLNAFNHIKKIIGVCPLCSTLGRIADHPCTHLGTQTAPG